MKNLIYKVQSSKDKDTFYVVMEISGKGFVCNCPGFIFRNYCRHVKEVKLGLHAPTLDLPEDLTMEDVANFLKYISPDE